MPGLRVNQKHLELQSIAQPIFLIDRTLNSSLLSATSVSIKSSKRRASNKQKKAEKDPSNVPKERTGYIRQDIQIPALAISCVLSCDYGCCFCFGCCCFQVPCDADRLKGRSRTTVSGRLGLVCQLWRQTWYPWRTDIRKIRPTCRSYILSSHHRNIYSIQRRSAHPICRRRFIIVKNFFSLWISCQEIPPFKGQA